MSRKGWPLEPGRHSMAARGMKTKKRTSRYEPAVAMGQKNPLKEQQKPEKVEKEALESICAKIEQDAMAQTGSEGEAEELLGDDAWLQERIDELIVGFELDDGIRSDLVARVRKRYEPNGK